MKLLTCLVMLLWLLLRAAPGHGAQLPLDLVVMVKGAEHGAGLVVSQSAARTVIVTALHVVRDSEQINAHDIGVEFNALRGKSFPATLASAYVDDRLDLAVLFVDHATGSVPRIVPSRFLHAVSPSPPGKLAGMRVQLVGAHRGPWTLGSPGDTIAGEADAMLRVRAAEVRPGASGGGLFDAFGRMLGMNSRIDGQTGELVVVPMAAIARRLQQWGIEYQLGTAQVGTGNAELLAVLRQANKIVVRQQGAAGYAVTLAAPAALVRLQASFRIVFPDALTLQPIALRAPQYSTSTGLPPVRLQAQLWMDTPDGRQTGPVDLVLPIDQIAEAALPAADPANASAVSRRALARATLRGQAEHFRNMERFAHDSKIKADQVQAQLRQMHSDSYEKYFRTQVILLFSKWSMSCLGAAREPGELTATPRARTEPQVLVSWHCQRSRLLGRVPAAGRLDRVVQALRLGEAPGRMKITVPVDHSVEDPDDFITKAVEHLLTEGKSTIYAELVLADGRTLGPRALCGVAQASPRLRTRRCQPPRLP